MLYLGGFVELTSELEPDTLRNMVIGAYRASRGGTVALAHNGLPARLDSSIVIWIRS